MNESNNHPSMQSHSLEEANRQMRAVFDASRCVTIIATEVDGTITFFNKGAEEILGYSSDEVIGKTSPAILHKRSEVEKRAAELTKELGYPVSGFETFVAYAKKGLYEEREWTYIRKDGVELTVVLSVTPIYDAQKMTIGFLGTAVDISDRKKVEEKLRASEELFRRLFEDSGDALLLLVDGTFVDCNDVTVQMLRANNKEEVLNTHPSDLSPEYQPDGTPSILKAQQMMDLAFERGHHRFEWIHKRVSGELFPVEVLLTAITIENKRVLHTCWRDITDRKEAEEKLRQSQKMEVIGQLAGGVAHDFNNMLSGIIGASELLESMLDLTPQQYELFQLLTSSAQRASDLTQQLLTFARKDTQNTTVFNIIHTIKDVKKLLEHTIDKNIEISITADTENVSIEGDKSQIENALMNLGINARDAMPNGGSLCFSIGVTECTEYMQFSDGFSLEKGHYAKIAISDTGSGIPQSLIHKIFEPFYTTKELGKGTGLGLASVYGTIKSHQGAIELQSKVDVGTTFTLYLPLYLDTATSIPTAEAKRVNSTGEGYTVLIIDDEKIVRTMLSIGLKEFGYKVITAADGDEGIANFTTYKESIDIIILDMIMPGMTGSACFRELRKIDTQIPIIVASGYTRDENIDELLAVGLSGYIAKPFSLESLTLLIQQSLTP